MYKKLFLCAAFSFLLNCPLSGQIPAAALKYRNQLIREVHATWGLKGDVAVFSSQITQESGWNPNAKSGVGAMGLGQVMAPTAVWLSKTYPKDLAQPAPYDAGWNIRALVKYDFWLYQRLGMYQEAGQNRIAAALSSYNAGLGWVIKAAKNASNCDGSLWWDCAENSRDGRTEANRKQSKDYPRRILLLYYPRYKAAGW